MLSGKKTLCENVFVKCSNKELFAIFLYTYHKIDFVNTFYVLLSQVGRINFQLFVKFKSDKKLIFCFGKIWFLQNPAPTANS